MSTFCRRLVQVIGDEVDPGGGPGLAPLDPTIAVASERPNACARPRDGELARVVDVADSRRMGDGYRLERGTPFPRVDSGADIGDIWSPMEANRLRQLCVVVETGGLRDAARLLHISHSGLSKSIKALDAVLFLPSGRGIVPTDVGRQVYTFAKKILANVEELERVARGDTPAKRPVRIGTFEVFSSTRSSACLCRRRWRAQRIVAATYVS